MPLYTYICRAGHEKDERTEYGDNTPRTCPTCGEDAERQTVYLITPFTESGVAIGRRATVPLDEKRVKVSKFQEAAAELEYNHKKLEETMQKEIPTPDYFHEGYRQGYAIRDGKRGPINEKF